jgi:hypothetical protein
VADLAKATTPCAHLVLLEMVMPEGDGPHFTKTVDLIMLRWRATANARKPNGATCSRTAR